MHLFNLVNPPNEREVEQVKWAYEKTDVPWHVIIPELRRKGQDKVDVVWTDTGQSLGRYWSNDIKIELTTKWDSNQTHQATEFTFVHEVGHLFDYATFDDKTRGTLVNLFHEDTKRHESYPEEHQSEDWWNRQDAYGNRLYEAWADIFTKIFAPEVWALKTGEGYTETWWRFTHRPKAWETVENICRSRWEATRVYEDEEQIDDAHKDNVKKAAELGLMQGGTDGKFRPKDNLTREQAATIMVRLYEKLS